ncbi:MAG: hypothetical protein SFX73_21995 [Kofleriaceae bacterium]|nr:hypothetical protein [Kofleriaceae bacterium]
MAAHVAATRLGLPVARVLDRLLTLYAEERERARERARSPLMYSPLVPLGMWPGAPSGPPRLGYAQPPPEPQPARLAKIIPFPTSTPTMHGPA